MLQTLLGEDKIENLKHYLKMTEKVLGSIIEVGVYMGGGLYHLAMESRKWNKPVIGYDTFKGLNEVNSEIEPKLHIGQFKNDDPRGLELAFFKLNLRNVRLIKGVFPASCLKGPISFAHLDVDTYESTLMALTTIHFRLSPGGIIVVDDYKWKSTPGVETAVNVFKTRFELASKYNFYLTKSFQFIMIKKV